MGVKNPSALLEVEDVRGRCEVTSAPVVRTEERKVFDRAMRLSRAWVRRLFGKVREQKEAELEAEYLERVQGEDERHAAFFG